MTVFLPEELHRRATLAKGREVWNAYLARLLSADAERHEKRAKSAEQRAARLAKEEEEDPLLQEALRGPASPTGAD